MGQTSHVNFENIEDAHEYVGLLCEAVDEAAHTIEHQMDAPSAAGRHLDALHLVDYKLKTLRHHLLVSRRLLNDLRTLRRYLLDERGSGRAENTDSEVCRAM
jgi:hypothetical protein